MHYRNIPKTLLFLLLCCPSMGLTGCSTTAQGDTGSFSPADYVNPFIGASTSTSAAGVYHGLGKTFPGATTPYGMVQVSPNTITGGDNSPGYSYEHTTIEGFAFTQMSGVGWFGDLGNLLDLFDVDNTVLVPDPVYPVYVDDNVMAGRKILYMSASAENNFLPMPDDNVHADIVYLCSPNNPTGATYTVDQLKEWVRWAKANNALILFDAAYECFVSEPGLARSIYEVEGAKDCAVEVCSFSKIAGFTGTRCGYTVVPQAIVSDGQSLNKMWLRRQTTKFNGVAYVVQRGAEAVFAEEGMKEIQHNLAYYRQNAAVIAAALDEAGVWYCGGKNSPYIWLRCPNNMGSWEFFDWLLETANVVGTPGEGFGECGKGYFRLTAFGDAAKTKEAAARIVAALKTL